MRWSPQQATALDRVGAWYEARRRGEDVPQHYYLAGYAGTGKTTLALHLAQHAGRVAFAAYTGKAALVMRQKGCAGATTIHSLIYLTTSPSKSMVEEMERELSRLVAVTARTDQEEAARLRLAEDLARLHATGGRPMFLRNPASDITDADLVVVDECSMVGNSIGTDLLSYGVPVLVLGDPAQLPPVGDGGYFTARDPDFLLTEVHRQARESPILRLATEAREGRRLQLGDYGDGTIVARADRDAVGARVMKADQLLVGRNRTRHASCARFRTLLGLGGGDPWPVPGDKVVCLRNNHELGLLNGALWRVTSAMTYPERMRVEMTVVPEAESDGLPTAVEAHAHHFAGREEELAWWDRREAQEFAYGYALTVHKAQGSQWDDLVLVDESSAFRTDAPRHLYTGITRAAKKIAVFVPS